MAITTDSAKGAANRMKEEDAPPAYEIATGSASALAHKREPMFPAKIGFYHPKPPTKASNTIGPHRNQPLFALERKDSWSVLNQGEPDVQLYDSIDSSQSNLLASVVYGRQPVPGELDWLIMVNPQQGGKTTALLKGRAVKGKIHNYALAFSVTTDIAGQMEAFEWRDSRHSNIKAALGTSSIAGGWKLVRMKASASVEGKKGKDNWVSDGKDVVAACTGTNGFSKFYIGALLGMGASGALGPRWELMVLITMSALMDRDFKRRRETS